MKKFFKALALVLALTLVIGTIPASAASTYNIKTKRTMYVAAEGANLKEPAARGTKTEADGTVTKSTSKARLSYATLLGLSKAEAEKHVISITSTNDEIVKANDDTQHIRAYSIGTATLTITVDGKVEGNVTITSKKNSTDDTIVFGTKEEYVNAGQKELTLGKEYKLSLPRLGNDTDYRKLVVKNEKGEEVADVAVEQLDAKGKGTRLWTLNFKTVGTYTLQGFGYQSPKYPDVISVGEVLTVTVNKPVPKSVKQVESNAFLISFEKGVQVTEDDFKAAIGYENFIYSMVSDAQTPFSLIQSIAVNKDKDGKNIENEWVVRMYSDFVGGTEYFVNYAGKAFENNSFVASGSTLADVASVVVTTTSVPAESDEEVKYDILNAAGVKINHAVSSDYVSISINNADLNNAYGSNPNFINFYEAGKTARVTITVDRGYDANGNILTPVKSAETTITSYDGMTISDVRYTIVASPSGYINEWSDTSKFAHEVAVDDKNVYLQVIIKNAAGKWITLEDMGISSIQSADGNLISVIDEIDDNQGHKGLEVKADNAGSTYFVLYKENASGNEVPVKSLPVTIKAKRYAASIETNVSKATLNINPADSLFAEIIVKDQYGTAINDVDARFAGFTLKIEQKADNVTRNGEFDLPTTTLAGDSWRNSWYKGFTYQSWNGGYRYIFQGADASGLTANIEAGKSKAYYFTVTAGFGGKTVTKDVNFNIGNMGDEPKRYEVNATATALDTNVAYKVDNATAKVTYDGYVGTYFTGSQTLYNWTATPTNKMKVADVANGNQVPTVASGGSIFAYTIVKDNKFVSDNINDFGKGPELNTFTKKTLTGWATTGSAINKLPKGSYVVTIYEISTEDDVTLKVAKKGQKTITVTDNQVVPTVTKKADKADSTNAEDILKCFEIKLNGSTDGIAECQLGDVTISESAHTINVKSIKVLIYDTNYDAYFGVTVSVNKLLKF